jgi:lipopolysaccharide transport system permease protein
MQNFSASPRSLLLGCWKNRELITALAKREVASRYKGSTMGLVWAVATPLFMLGVYTFVFSVVFKARWDTAMNSRAEFALVLFVGLTIFNIFAECIGRAPTLITQNSNYVKKVVFPLEILPCITMGAALFQGAMNLVVWLVFYCIFVGAPHGEALLLPLVLTPLLLSTLGLSWLLASLGTFLRDLSQVVSLGLTVLMFLSPIFYPSSALPARYQSLLQLNPIATTVEQARGLLVQGIIPPFSMLAVQFSLSFLIAWVCFAWFQKTRRAFADVV